MQTAVDLVGENLHLSLLGHLRASQLAPSFWSGLQASLEDRAVDPDITSLYIDLRWVESVDSRSLFHLRDLAQCFLGQIAVQYIGPGPGIRELQEEDEAPHLHPMVGMPPWESEAPTIVLVDELFDELMDSIEESQPGDGPVAGLIGEETPVVEERFMEGSKGRGALPLEAEAVRPRTLYFWEEVVRGYQCDGISDLRSRQKLLHSLDGRAPSIATSIAEFLEGPITDDATRSARSLAIVLSTLVREGSTRAELAAATRVVLFASLVHWGPGRFPDVGEFQDDIEGSVRRLLDDADHAFIPTDDARIDLESLLALWRAATVIGARSEREREWRDALGQALSHFDGEDRAQAAVRRVTAAHSLYLPGRWVELTSGEIGPVLGGLPGHPDCPRVMILFRRAEKRFAATTPRLFPAPAEKGIVSVRQVLWPPTLSILAPEPGSVEEAVEGILHSR